jgi:polysaccharide biosynthesis/export protein
MYDNQQFYSLPCSIMEGDVMKVPPAIMKTVTATLFLLFLVIAGSCLATESSADTVVSDATKEQYRQEVLGNMGQEVDPEYVIGYRDILYVEIYGEGSMAVVDGGTASTVAGQMADGQDAVRGRGTGAEVGTDGRVSLRHIGDVYVVGMTLTQLADYLKKLYSALYGDPMVITSLMQSNSRQYTVMGQVNNPGLYHLDYPITIVKAIARAGGFGEWSKSRVTVIRQANELIPGGDPGQNVQAGKSFQFNYNDFLRGRGFENNILLEPGDVVVVH